MSLAEEFIRDHREMARLLRQLLVSLENDEDVDAFNLADAVDRIAGPHVQFEMTVLHPEFVRPDGEKLEEQLRLEHHCALTAIRFLQAYQDAPQIAPELRAKLQFLIQLGLDYFEATQPVLSQLTLISAIRETQFLNTLHEMKQAGLRWTTIGKKADT